MKGRLAITLALLTLVLSVLACNLTEPPTPTFIPPPTYTIPPPIEPVTRVPELPAETATPAPTEVAAIPAAIAPMYDASIAYHLEQVDNDRLLISVNELVSFGTRYVNAEPESTTSGIGGAREWILGRFRAIEEEARTRGVPFVILPHSFVLEWRGKTTTQINVVAYLPGVGDRANEVIIVGAHYDSISEVPDISAPGADDNASGVAVMLECARVMAQSRHQATVVFVAFSAEDTGRQGSEAFLREVVQVEGWDVRAMINLDVVGAQTGPDGAVIGDRVRVFSAPPNDSPSRQLARTMHMIASSFMPDFWVDMQSTTDRDGRWGDHLTFSNAGYPAVRLTEAAEDPARSNTTRDTAEWVSARYMSRVARVVIATLLVLADGPPPPTNLAFKTGNPGGQELTWAPSPNAAGYIVAVRNADRLTFSRWFQVGALNVFAWNGESFSGLDALAVAAIDVNGRQGSFSPEVAVPLPGSP